MLVAAHSVLDQDAVCRFLDAQSAVEVVAEVRSAALVADAVAAHRPDVLILSHTLPDMPARPLALVQALDMSPSQIIYILPDSRSDPAAVIGLRKLGVRHLLSGAFTGETLLRLIAAALPPVTVIACQRRSGSIGQSTVALGLFLYCLSRGMAAYLVDRSADGLLARSLTDHPQLSAACGPRLLSSSEALPPYPAVCVIDGPWEPSQSRSVTVLSAPALGRPRSPADPGGLCVLNQVLGRCRLGAGTALALPRLRQAPVDLLAAGRPLPAQVVAPFRDLFRHLRLEEVIAIGISQQPQPLSRLQPGGGPLR